LINLVIVKVMFLAHQSHICELLPSFWVCSLLFIDWYLFCCCTVLMAILYICWPVVMAILI